MTKASDVSKVPSSRRLRRFFTEEVLNSPGQEITLSREETHHLKNLIRLKPGDSCLVTDGSGKEGEARIKSFSAAGETKLVLETLEPVEAASEFKLVLKIHPALLQKGKMDELVEKAQELGVQEILPVESERTMVKMSQTDAAKVLSRWERLAREAAKQSGSKHIVRLNAPKGLPQSLEAVPAVERKIIFHPNPEARPFQDWIKSVKAGQVLHLFLGPEGGWSQKEIRLACDKGAEVVELGPTVLKADTAFLGIAGALRFLYL